MKIISSFKDYYDFMVSKYGMDSKIVYERVPQEEVRSGLWGKTGMFKPPHIDDPDRIESYDIYFCGKHYIMYYVFGDWFGGEGILDAHPEKYPHYIPGSLFTGNRKDVPSLLKQWKGGYAKRRSYLNDESKHGSKSNINDEFNCPVVYGKHKNVRLSDFSFGKIMPPEEAFITISNWLSRDKAVPDNQTNDGKIVSHGFDLKTSFRKM